jgi:predicted Zn-dependent protease
LQTYQAILIHPDISGGRCSGELHINPNNVTFRSAEINYEIHFRNLEIAAGGAGNRFIFFKDKTRQDISVYTPDRSVLKNINIASNAEFARHISKANKTVNSLLIGSLVVVAVIALIIAGLYLYKDKMVEGLAGQVPVEWEQEAGEKLFSTISAQYDFVKNDSLKTAFLKVAAPLFKQAEEQGYKIELYFVKDPTINAFALPGGKLVVQTGLIENATSWEEVMGVLGHELAHVTRRHHVRGIINNIGIYAILSATIGDVSAIAGTFASLGGDLASLSNSRSFENEADETGWDYLVNAEMDPRGLITFFETLKREYETKSDSDSTSTGGIDLSFLSTHPNTQDRIDHLKKKEEKLNRKFVPLPANFNDFKAALLKIN